MIKLIASDIDGTLLQNGDRQLRPQLFLQVQRLAQKGILFCAASGRQYTSLRALFQPVAAHMAFVCENGAVVYQNQQVVAKTPMPRPQAEALIRSILDCPASEAMISGVNTSYLLPKQPGYLEHIRDFVGNNVQVIAGLGEIQEDIVKVSAYCPGGSLPQETPLGGPWKEVFQVAVAGEKWLDFTLADKGTGLAALCRRLGIQPEQVIAFGDNFNDLPMLRFAGWPYIIKGGMAEAAAPFCKKTNRVESVLETL